jgi:DNA polymerase-3 subunit delta'
MADRCIEADYEVRRNAGRSMIFESLAHDLGTILNRRTS